jgi:peptidoglycan-associated lipoprotein
MKTTKACLLVTCAVALLAGCSSAPKNTTAANSTPPPAASAPVPAADKPASTVASVVLPAYLDPKSPIHTDRSIYFDFDNFSIKKDYASVIERQGQYLSSHPSLSIKVEGNADERGSAEYNLALGQKRAQSVLKALSVYGVKESQMEAISWGREKPKATGHDEAAWEQNRRVDLGYPNR